MVARHRSAHPQHGRRNDVHPTSRDCTIHAVAHPCCPRRPSLALWPASTRCRRPFSPVLDLRALSIRPVASRTLPFLSELWSELLRGLSRNFSATIEWQYTGGCGVTAFWHAIPHPLRCAPRPPQNFQPHRDAGSKPCGGHRTGRGQQRCAEQRRHRGRDSTRDGKLTGWQCWRS